MLVATCCHCAFAATLHEFLPPWMISRAASAVISHDELMRLAEYDLVVVIDSSASMTYKCGFPPGALGREPDNIKADVSEVRSAPMTRWEWCLTQAAELTRQTSEALGGRLSVVLFANNSTIYKNVSPTDIRQILASRRPTGGTRATDALKRLMDAYFERKAANGEQTRPLLIAFITDGCPEDACSLRSAIVRATRKMDRPGEINLTFLQVGNDPRAPKLLEGLKRKLMQENAQFDIVNVKRFAELNKKGLARALYEVISAVPANPRVSSN